MDKNEYEDIFYGTSKSTEVTGAADLTYTLHTVYMHIYNLLPYFS